MLSDKKSCGTNRHRRTLSIVSVIGRNPVAHRNSVIARFAPKGVGVFVIAQPFVLPMAPRTSKTKLLADCGQEPQRRSSTHAISLATEELKTTPKGP